MSNRLTFSLASLIFLIALGLVFAPTSVMAHEVDSTNNGTGQVHQGDTDGDTNHGAHPMVTSIVLESGGKVRDDMVEVTDPSAQGGTAEDAQFTLVITFDQEVVSAPTIVSAAADNDSATPPVDNVVLAGGEYASALTLGNNAASNGAVTIADATRVEGSNNQFKAVATLATAFPTGTSGAGAFIYRISVKARAAYSPQTHPRTSIAAIPGGPSEPSMVYAFTLVNELPTLAMLTGGDPDTQDDGTIDVTFTSDKAVTNVMVTATHTPAGLADSYMVSDVTSDDNDHMVTVTLMDATASMDYPAGTITLTATAMSMGEEITDMVNVEVAARTYHKAPFFPAGLTIPPIKIWAMNAYTPMGDDRIILPKARAAEGVDYLYKVRKKGGDAGDPQQLPGGFELLNDDVENRTLEVREANKADSVAMAKTTYEYIAYNVDAETAESDPIEFTIEVVARTVPTAPTMVMAAEEGLTPDPLDRMINNNRVVVNWEAPVNDPDYLATFSAPHDKINFGSPVTHYEVIQTGKVTAGNANGTPDAMYPDDDPNTMKIDGKHTMKIAGDDTSYKTPELASQTDRSNDLGVYEYQVRAVNGVGTGPSNKVDKDSTATVWNPPAQPEDLRDAKEGTEPGSVILNWLPVSNTGRGEGDADGGTDDQLVTQYRITIVPPEGDPDRTQTTDDDSLEFQVEDLESGRHVFRVAAVNSDGVGRESNSTTFDVQLPDSPADVPNNEPTFGDEKIESIVATAGEAINGRVLPEATDADTDDTLTYAIEDENGMATTSPGGLTFNATHRTLRGTPTAAMDETAYIYKVSDGNGGTDTIPFFITVNAATAGPPPTSTPGRTLPAKGLIVYVRDLNNPPHFGTSNPLVAEWSAMPNLEALFNEGGGGSLQLTVTGVTKRQVVFSEIMWAVDEGKVGQDSYDGNQWIELYNRTDNAIDISKISFAVKADGRPALPESTDLVSNVVGGGNDWIKAGKGQNGNSADGSKKEFRSMYRKRYHNDSAGWSAGEWLEAKEVYHPNFKGTPGAEEPKSPQLFAATNVTLDTVFNEVANFPSSNKNHEWIELRKRDGELSNLENWTVRMLTGASDRDVASSTNPTQTKLFTIPKLNDGRYGGILLITKTDPARDDDHPLRGGYNVEKSDEDQSNEGLDPNIRYYVADDWTEDLPDNGEFVLILRNHKDKTNHENVVDIAGWHPNLKVDRANFFSGLWPLRGYAAPVSNKNAIVSGAVHRRQHAGIVGTGTTHNDKKDDQVALRDVGWTGIGYKRNADAGAQNGGTPGYPNNALQSNETEASGDPVIISEIMYATGDRGNMPQWIELRNTSQTVGVNLDGWRVTIVNHDLNNADGTTYPDDLVKQYNINGKIPPGQTFLITAHSGTDNTNLPSERIVSIRNRRGELILSQYGFEITLETKGKDNKDANRKEADKVGNLAAGADARVRGNPQSYAEPAWMLPAGTNADGDRVSIVRVSGRTGLLNGLDAGAWRSFDMSAHLNAPESTYYGNRNDLASPGYTIDGVLPVSLSKFRPERLATGEVVVRWVTESETNNAGFNILRGEKLDGEFTKLNEQLIAGKGTTSEKNTYDFVDKSAKPNVVYYYQIQDVSLDGEVATLKTTHLRGNISVVGKLTTTWGELKALQ